MVARSTVVGTQLFDHTPREFDSMFLYCRHQTRCQHLMSSIQCFPSGPARATRQPWRRLPYCARQRQSHSWLRKR